MRLSKIAYLLCACILFGATFLYSPRWQKSQSEATIGWDVSGYYAYLPAIFIYKDLKQAQFLEPMREKYLFTPSAMQGIHTPNGNFVMKYSMGQALQLLPGFVGGHLVATALAYPTDGYSKPYQLAVSVWSFFISLIGLWFARKSLLRFFSERTTAFTLLALIIGTNYLNYATTDAALTHNWLFTCISIIIWLTIRFYEEPTYPKAILIGTFCGWATLTRPTEALIILVPVFWGVYHLQSLISRVHFILLHFSKYMLAAIFGGAVASLQVFYWKYVSGYWLYYTYGTENFQWETPHLFDVTFSYRCGWVLYTPLMVFAVLGLFWLLKKQKAIFPVIAGVGLLAYYVASCWSTWWYGGTIGMRASVQHYALWVFPLAAFIQGIQETRFFIKWSVTALMLACAGLSIWWYREAHTGHAFVGEQMTQQFYKQVIGRRHFEQDWLKLLDTEHIFKGVPKNAVSILSHDFETDTIQVNSQYPLEGLKTGFIDQNHQYSPEWKTAAVPNKSWYRASCLFAAETKEWEYWKMTQFVMKFYHQNTVIHSSGVRLHRFIDGGETKEFYFDVKAPSMPFDTVSLHFWNAEGAKVMRFDRIALVAFDE